MNGVFKYNYHRSEMTESQTTTYKSRLSNLESFYDDTKYEWYVAKHRKPSQAELDLVNSLLIKCFPHCGGTHFKNQVTSAMEQEDVVVLTAAKRSPH